MSLNYRISSPVPCGASSAGPIATPCDASDSGIVAPNKKSTTRRNAWGNMSYADLITQAIVSSPEKRLTLSQGNKFGSFYHYQWIVGSRNMNYFQFLSLSLNEYEKPFNCDIVFNVVVWFPSHSFYSV